MKTLIVKYKLKLRETKREYKNSPKNAVEYRGYLRGKILTLQYVLKDLEEKRGIKE